MSKDTYIIAQASLQVLWKIDYFQLPVTGGIRLLLLDIICFGLIFCQSLQLLEYVRMLIFLLILYCFMFYIVGIQHRMCILIDVL